MGLSNFYSPSEGILPLLAMNAVMSVNHVKNMLRPFLQVFGALAAYQESEEEYSDDDSAAKRVYLERRSSRWRKRCDGGNKWAVMECCVCLRRFKDKERVSELCCNHLFHKCCLDKWFDNYHNTCPLCRRCIL
ncbi:probable E3 ubiquitin-protein ligase XERICO [Henckelia pumila]|uniref:probable E3 ubiquitin-protein ligase XERICO n=1 Tax=Henckelia pumila TaxID=405737 RepID=UPI003C6E1B1B